MGMDGFSIYKVPCEQHAPTCQACADKGCPSCDGKGKKFASQLWNG